MTEADWLGSADPATMLRHLCDPVRVDAPGGSLTGRLAGEDPPWMPSDRKLLRLFACACCRALWDFLSATDRKAVKLAERWADGEAVHDELYCLVSNSQGGIRWLHWADSSSAAFSVIDSAYRHNKAILPCYANLLRDVIGNPFRIDKDQYWPYHKRQQYCTTQVLSLAQAAYEERPPRHRVCGGVMEDFPGTGGAWCRCLPCRETKSRNDNVILFDGTLDPARLAVLSDALEELGCDDDVILSHLRSPGPHVRGCWALDLILGKE